MKRKLRIFLLGFVLLSIAGLFGIVYVKNSSEPETRYEEPPSRAQETSAVIGKVRYAGYSGEDRGQRQWELEAESATRLKKEDLTVFIDVKVVFYSKGGTIYTLRGQEGSYREETGEIRVTGDVRMDAVGGGSGSYNIETDGIKYSTRSKEVTSSDPVRIRYKAMEVTGVGLEIDLDVGRCSILKDVRTVIEDAVI
jgi:LPS export ABC transporter protein LptC